MRRRSAHQDLVKSQNEIPRPIHLRPGVRGRVPHSGQQPSQRAGGADPEAGPRRGFGGQLPVGHRDRQRHLAAGDWDAQQPTGGEPSPGGPGRSAVDLPRGRAHQATVRRRRERIPATGFPPPHSTPNSGGDPARPGVYQGAPSQSGALI